jgi:glycerophosphoryl diester phosphodiesterase
MAAKFTSGAECDVRLSRDGIPMVFHDADLRRLCGIEGQLDAYDSGWLGDQLLLGTDETIPTLAAVLHKWPAHLSLLIECKTRGSDAADLARAVASALRDLPRNAGIMSFDPSISRWLSVHQPDLPRGLVVDADWPIDFRLQALDRARPQFLAVDVRLIGDAWTTSMRERMPVYCWTVRTAAERAQAEVQADALIWEGDGRPRN